MKRIDAVVIGGGQAGLAMSRELGRLGIDHVVLERGRVAERWRTERWASLRLLSPNWMTRLPGYRYGGDDPDGFMTKDELVTFLEGYASSFSAPVRPHTSVIALRPSDCCGYRVITDHGTWIARAVVVATGPHAIPVVPQVARYLPAAIEQVTPDRYVRPSQLPSGNVLVVGASSTGVQLAAELQASGRQVTLAVGRHTRVPRRYRGRDILWWLDRMGAFDETPADVADADASVRQPSMQLVGNPAGAPLGLIELARQGVRLMGRVRDIDRARVRFADDLIAHTAAADLKLAALLQRIDRFIDDPASTERAGEPSGATEAEPFEPSWPLSAEASVSGSIDLSAEGITSIVWATGYAQSYAWIDVPVKDARGGIRHTGGVTPASNLFVIGLPFLRRRKSAFLDGVGDDAIELARHLSRSLAGDRTREPIAAA